MRNVENQGNRPRRRPSRASGRDAPPPHHFSLSLNAPALKTSHGHQPAASCVHSGTTPFVSFFYCTGILNDVFLALCSTDSPPKFHWAEVCLSTSRSPEPISGPGT